MAIKRKNISQEEYLSITANMVSAICTNLNIEGIEIPQSPEEGGVETDWFDYVDEDNNTQQIKITINPDVTTTYFYFDILHHDYEEAMRVSPYFDFDKLQNEEPEIVQLLKKPLRSYNLILLKQLTKDQEETLKNTVNYLHQRKFRQNIPNFIVTYNLGIVSEKIEEQE